MLPCLFLLFEESEKDHEVRDNAAGAVAKIIMDHQNSVPLYRVLPILLKATPLKKDYEESIPVYNCIYNLVLSSNQLVLV